jgi:hypothetical protein
MLNRITGAYRDTNLTRKQLWVKKIVNKLSEKNISLTPAEINILSVEDVFLWHEYNLINSFDELEKQGLLSTQSVRFIIRTVIGSLFSSFSIGGIMTCQAIDALVVVSSELAKSEIKLDDFLDSLLQCGVFSHLFVACLRHLSISNLWTKENILSIELNVKSGTEKLIKQNADLKNKFKEMLHSIANDFSKPSVSNVAITDLPDLNDEKNWMYLKCNYAIFYSFYEALDLYTRLGILNQNNLNMILSLESPVHLYSFYEKLSTYSFIDEAMIKTTLHHPNLSGMITFLDKYSVSKVVGLSLAQKYIIEKSGAKTFELNKNIFSYLIREDFISHNDPYAICALFILDTAGLLTEKNYHFILKGTFSCSEENTTFLKDMDIEVNALILRHLNKREEYNSYPAIVAEVNKISIPRDTTTIEGLIEMLGVYLCEKIAETKQFGQKFNPLCYDLFQLHHGLSEAYSEFKSSNDHEQFRTSTNHLISLHKKSIITAQTMVEWVQDFLEYLVDAIVKLFRPISNENQSRQSLEHSPRFFFAERPGQYIIRQIEFQSEDLVAQNQH